MPSAGDAQPAAPRPRVYSGATVEGNDPALAAALAEATFAPTPERLRSLAAEYRRLEILDLALHHAQRALALAPQDALSHDVLARLWRDAGFPGLGLSAAHRAVYFDPGAAGHRNTLGTLLQALGHRELARHEYERAAVLDPHAWYVFNNLCYSWTLEGHPAEAIAACRRALALHPGSVAARNNLALAFAVAGDRDSAVRMFRASGDPARARYNEGVLHLAQGRFTTALESFEAAYALNPNLQMARQRARQAAAAALAEE